MYPFVEETTPPLSPSIEETETIPSLSPSMEETPSPTNHSINENESENEDEDISLSMFPSMEELKSPPNRPYMEETTPTPTALPLSLSPAMEEILPYQPTAPPPPPFFPPPEPLIASGLVMGLPLTIPQRVVPTADVARNHPRVPSSWSTGLFDCHKDLDNCCLTCFCPCITFGQNAEIIDHGSSSCCGSGLFYASIMFLTGCHCLYSCFYRSKMRGQFFLKESPCADCCIHCFCEPCALCQEYRELRYRGLHPSFGWHGNVARQNAMVPPSTITMTR